MIQMECRRILKSKKTFIVLLILLLFNGLWYLYQQENTWKYYNLSLTQVSTTQQEYLSKIKGLSNEDQLKLIKHAREHLSSKTDHLLQDKKFSEKKYKELSGQDIILEGLEKQLTHISEYQKKVAKVHEQAELMSSISIFQTDDSFSQKNIQRTAKDYNAITNIHLSASVSQPVTNTFFDPLLQYLNVIFILFIVLSFIEERKIGLWEKVHSTPNGRTKLALNRVLILFSFSILFQFVIVTERFVMASILYGKTDIFRLVQSIPEFMKFIYPVNILQYLFIYCIICGLCSFCFGLFAWLLLQIFHSPIISIFVLCIITACEWVINFFLPSQSFFSLFKYLNFYYFLSPSKDLVEYCNLNLFGIIANRFIVVIVSLIVLAIGNTALITTLANKIKPIRIPGILDRVWKKVARICGNFWRRLLSKRSSLFFETYKTFFSYKGYIIILVLIVYLISSLPSYQMSFSREEITKNNFYNEYSGPIIQKNYQKYLEITKEAKKIVDCLQKANQDFEAKKITVEQLSQIKIDVENSTPTILLSNKLTEDYQRLKQLEKKNHITPWFNNTSGIELMFHEKAELNRLLRIEICVLIMILLVSFSYSLEEKSAVKNKLRSTVNGRSGLFRKKIAMNCFICFLITGILWIYDYLYYAKIFPMGSLLAPIQTLKTLDHIPFQCSVLTFLVFLFIVRWILLCNLSFFVSFLSAKFNTIVTIILSFLLFLVPSLLGMIGIKLFKTVAVIDSMTLIQPLLYKNVATDIKIKLIALFIFGITGIYLCYVQWCKKGVGYETRA